jgi:hypothetical protein
MQKIIELFTLIMNNWQTILNSIMAILSALFVLSEVLAQIPWIKANSVFQLVFNWLSKTQK